jgi:hypothetical protein
MRVDVLKAGMRQAHLWLRMTHSKCLPKFSECIWLIDSGADLQWQAEPIHQYKHEK